MGSKTASLGIVTQASIQLREPLLEKGYVFGFRRLELTKVFFVDVRDLSRLDAFEEPHDSVSLLMPILRTHRRLLTLALSIAEAGL
jgi:hypothetical protein